MSNIANVVLTTPHADYSGGRVVEAGLEALGFVTPEDADRTVWLLLGHKLNYYAEGKFGIDGLRDLVLALPWHRWGAPTHLEVLWADEHTTSDDSWGGRRAPYSWNRETWEVPA